MQPEYSTSTLCLAYPSPVRGDLLVARFKHRSMSPVGATYNMTEQNVQRNSA